MSIFIWIQSHRHWYLLVARMAYGTGTSLSDVVITEQKNQITSNTSNHLLPGKLTRLLPCATRASSCAFAASCSSMKQPRYLYLPSTHICAFHFPPLSLSFTYSTPTNDDVGSPRSRRSRAAFSFAHSCASTPTCSAFSLEHWEN